MYAVINSDFFFYVYLLGGLFFLDGSSRSMKVLKEQCEQVIEELHSTFQKTLDTYKEVTVLLFGFSVHYI